MTLLSPDTPPAARSDVAPSDLTDALTRFVRDLSDSTLTVAALYERLADTARALIGVEGSCVLEVEPGGYRVGAPSGITSVCRGHLFTLDTMPPLFRQVLLSGTAACDNGDTAPKQSDDGPQFPIEMRQLAATPIMLGESVQGLLVSVNHHNARFGAEDVALMGYLSAHGALVMRSRSLVQQAEHAADDARTRAVEAARAAHVNGVLVKAARALADATTRERLYAGLADVLVQELGAAGFGVYDADPVQRTARVEYQWGSANIDPSRVEAAFWHTPLAHVVLQEAPVFIADLRHNDPDSDIAQTLIEAGVFALALLPLVLEERTQGVLAVSFPGTRRFEDADRALLRDLTTQVALAFRTTLQFGELERRADRLALVTRAQQQLTPLIGTERLPTAIAEAVHLVIPCQIVDVLSLGEDGLQRLVRIQNGQVEPSAPIPITETELVRETSLSGIPRLASCLVPVPESGLARGSVEMCALIRAGRRNVGVIRLVDTRSDFLSLQDLDLLSIMARHAGTAIESARLFALQDFQRQRAEGAAEVARVTLQATTLAEGTIELVQVLDRLIPSNGKALGVARARDGQIEYVATSGTLDPLKGHRPGSAKGIDQFSPDGQPTELHSLRDVAPDGLADTLPDEWTLVVPLAARERTLGVLLVTAPRTAPLRQRDRITLERLSTSIALALDALLLDEDEGLAREREQLLATAITIIDHPIFILDRVGVRYANPAAAREYRWSQVELMELQFDQLVASRGTREGQQDTDGLLDAGIQLSHDIHRRRDGTEFPAAVTANALTGTDGEWLGQVISVRNISQDQRLEEQLRQTEKMVALGELVAGVAHEINNPLTGISAFAQILLEEELSGDQRESIQLIKQESDRAKMVIKDLLLFARKTDRGAGPVDINDIVEQTVRLRSYPLRHAGVTVSLELDPAAPQIIGDSQKLQQVLLNIIGNAEYAMLDRPERRLVLRTTHDGGRVMITAADTGRGMTPEVRRRIFEPFFSTKPAGNGTGLGLSVSYGIIHAHGGTITVESEADAGATVTIALPAVPSERP